jgi:hypothetical protein
MAAMGIRVEARNRKGRGTVWLNCRCPFAARSWQHKFSADRSPSAGVVADTSGRASNFLCYTCKRHGTLSWIARELGHDDLADAIEDTELAGLGAIDLTSEESMAETLPPPLVEEAYEGLWPAAYSVPEAAAYLSGRRISQATAEHLGLVYEPKERRIRFPVRDRSGGLQGWSRRTILPEGKPKILDRDLPKRHLILGSHAWEEGKPLLLVEGLFAYARMFEERVDDIANIGALMGSILTEEKAELVRNFDHQTYLLLDNDAAGDVGVFGVLEDDGKRRAGTGALDLLTKHVPLYIPAWPEGKDDPDQLTYDEVNQMLSETPQYNLFFG